MRFHVWLVVVWVGFCLTLPTVAAAGDAPPDTAPEIEGIHGHPAIVVQSQRDRLAAPEIVTARAYVSPDLTIDALPAALDVARSAFAAAAVEITWKVCGPSKCHTPPSPTEIMVRFVDSRGRRLDARCLGEALIDSQKGTGVMATVFLDRVLHLARNLEIDHRVLLGRTIAHEIGHLLLATSTHGESGLMRELWSRKELIGKRADDWILHPFEAAAIRQRLALSRSREQHIVTRY